MSAYSIVNLKEEVEDSMGERAPGIEGRFARKHLDSEYLGISYLQYSPGVRSPSAHNLRRIATANRRGPTSSSAAPDKSDSTTRSASSAAGCRSRQPRNGAGVRSRDDGLDLIASGSDRPDGI